MLFEKLADPTVLRTNKGLSNLKSPTRYTTSSFTHGPQTVGRANEEDRNWQMKATYVEVFILRPVISARTIADYSSKIYNDQLRDLLATDHVPQGERTTVAIREDTQGRILLTGLHQVEIKSMDDLLRALNFGSSIRQTDATVINAKSSRSHAVFSISLVQRRNRVHPGSIHEMRHSVPLEEAMPSDNWVTIDSKLHFVDLAGSERLKNTGASGDRAKEGISINVGLASLGKVISQLSLRHPGSHISYRDSKLTRLLQDSLGGNAITYMIACVTSAEFYLSETLNTVKYAQRARAIQSKPQIQQISSDESDKQALIDRLRAEISFLRDQIRSSETCDRLGNIPQERAERQNGRESELQNDLINARENWAALSQRHAKLISEITMVRHSQELDESPVSPDVLGDLAMERLQRSNSFAEAVEQVVLEYEKTIQCLQTSLSTIRSSLSATESSLLEKEAKCANVETVNQQLQDRVQKMIDRESSTDIYLRDLESKLNGHSSGEEKSSIIIAELRKEIAGVRESEASCEEYISTLEQRLAEADQSIEFMQREVYRLKHVVERQRNLKRLGSLFVEYGDIQLDENEPDERASYKPLTIGRSQSSRPESSLENRNAGSSLGATMITTTLEAEDRDAATIMSPTSFDVKPRTPPPPDQVFSPGSQLEISRRSSVYSQLTNECLGGDSTGPFELTSVEGPYQKAISSRSHAQDPKSETLSREIEKLKMAQAERDSSLIAWDRKYSQLQKHHNETLELVEELKVEVQKAKQINPPLIRRKGSQMNDRAHRSLASLRKIALENFADKPDAMQSFETNISTAMHELHQRFERVQVLEAELLISKKEMESKTTIISGLARERSSLGIQSPMNMSMVSSIHEQLLQAENQMKIMQESHAVREHELVTEIASLTSRVDGQTQRISELELLYDSARHEIEGAILYKIDSKANLDSLQEQVGSLKGQLEDYQSVAESHASRLRSLQESHAQALELMQSARSKVEGQLRSQTEEAEKKDDEREERFLESMEAVHQQLKRLVDFPDDVEDDITSVTVQSILGLVSSIKDRLSQYGKYMLNADLRLTELEEDVLHANRLYQERLVDLQRVTEERDRYSRVVDQLEDQISLSFDQRVTSSRLSKSRDQPLQDGNTSMLEQDEIHRARPSQLEVYLPPSPSPSPSPLARAKLYTHTYFYL